jgi:hypothetical protein
VPTSRSQARPVRFALLDLSADGGAGDRIRSFVERIEQLGTELQELNEQE